MIRTTITVDDILSEVVERYRTGYETAFGRKPSFSEVVSNALQMALPVIPNRIPQEGEDLGSALIRRAQTLWEILHIPFISESMARAILTESSRLTWECERLFLGSNGEPNPHAYERCMRAAAKVTNLALDKGVLWGEGR